MNQKVNTLVIYMFILIKLETPFQNHFKLIMCVLICKAQIYMKLNCLFRCFSKLIIIRLLQI